MPGDGEVLQRPLVVAALEQEQQTIRSMLEGLLDDANGLSELLEPLRPQVKRLQTELKAKEDELSKMSKKLEATDAKAKKMKTMFHQMSWC